MLGLPIGLALVPPHHAGTLHRLVEVEVAAVVEVAAGFAAVAVVAD